MDAPYDAETALRARRRAFLIRRVLRTLVPLIALTHGYFWWRLVHDTALPAPWNVGATIAILVLGTLLPLPLLADELPRPFATAVAWIGYCWLGTLLFLVIALVAGDTVRIAAWLLGGPANAGGSLELRRGLAVAAAGISVVLGVFAILQARRLVVKEVSVELARLPAALDGTAIVQLTDMHIGRTLDKKFTAEVVARTNALEKDIVVITGDLADGRIEELREGLAPLGDLRAPHGVYFVTGNHEYYGDTDALLEELGRLGIRVLRNERVPIDLGAGGFDLAGVDDRQGRMKAGHGPDYDQALAGRDPGRAVVLLAHHPAAIEEAARRGVGLVISGHTHAGQIWPFNHLVRLDQPHVVGLVREGDTQMYVSPGTGYWGPPMRLGSTAEITRITLHAPA